jgi:lysophospholipase L1-like esterase
MRAEGNLMKRLALLTLAVGLLVAAPAGAAKTPTSYVVSLGDSFSAGVQPGPNTSMSFSYPKVSYAQQMISRASKLLHKPLKLTMLACGGATTQSMPGLVIKPCSPGVGGFKLPYNNTSGRTSQLAYALQFLRQHRGRIAFVVMTLGGNNLLRCVDSATGGFDLNCITAGYGEIGAQLPPIASRIRRAAGRNVPVMGGGYYDPYLQFYLRGGPDQGISQASLGLQSALNAALQKAYKQARWSFVSVDDEFGTNIPFDQTTNLDPYGQIPQAVADVCAMTWMCAPAPQGPNIHPNRAGYAAYASAFLTELRREVK